MANNFPLVDYNSPSNVSFSSFDALLPHQQRAQLAFEGQLAHVINLVEQLKTHPHFTDDCGEYLSSALELAAHLSSARENGIQSLCDYFVELSERSRNAMDEHSEDWLDDSNLFMDYATDGISAMVVNHCRWLRESHRKDRIPFKG